MMHVLQLIGRERHSVSLELVELLFSTPVMAFTPVLLLPVIFLIF